MAIRRASSINTNFLSKLPKEISSKSLQGLKRSAILADRKYMLILSLSCLVDKPLQILFWDFERGEKT